MHRVQRGSPPNGGARVQDAQLRAGRAGLGAAGAAGAGSARQRPGEPGGVKRAQDGWVDKANWFDSLYSG